MIELRHLVFHRTHLVCNISGEPYIFSSYRLLVFNCFFDNVYFYHGVMNQRKKYSIGICNLQNLSSTLSQDLINSLLLSVPIAPSCLILIDFQNIFIK